MTTSWDPKDIKKLRELKEKFAGGDGAGETPIHEVVDMEPRRGLELRKTCQMCGEPSRDSECDECYADLRAREDYERGVDPIA